MQLKLADIYQDTEHIDKQILETALQNNAIRDYAYILHDKDVDENGNLKKSHYHIAVRLKHGVDTKYIAEWFKAPQNLVNKVKGRWSDILKYLTHENAPDKFQYPSDEVISNFDWKTAKDTPNNDSRKFEILEGIMNGTIKEYNEHEIINIHERCRYNKDIEIAFKQRLKHIRGVDRDMDCYFITGDSGTGKTTYAKDLASKANYKTFISSGSNDILDGYAGEECIILDDLRASCMGLSDLLKMLDNNTSSSVKSRYKNKVLECKLIIITTVNTLEEFYRNVFKEEEEPVKQFKRRCKVHIRLTRELIFFKEYHDKIGNYGKEFKVPNFICEMYPIKEKTEEEQLKSLLNMLHMSAETMIEVVEETQKTIKEKENSDKQIDTSDISDLPWKI